jgi:hypothetical protein
MQGLRYRGWKPLGFQRSEGRVENCLGAAEFAEKLSGHACAQSWRQRKRQPSQILGGFHREESPVASLGKGAALVKLWKLLSHDGWQPPGHAFTDQSSDMLYGGYAGANS